MNEIKNYIENLDRKNFIMLIVSILILCFIVIYYFNNFFEKEHKYLLEKKIELVKKINETKILNNKIIQIKNRHRSLKTRYKNLHNDLIYLLSEIESSKILVIPKKKFLKILYNYLHIGENINASFDINQTKTLRKYNININGNFLPNQFFNFVYFIKTIEKPKAIITINNLNVSQNKDNIFYDMNISIWSFK